MPDPHGSDPGYRRPVVIIQSNPFNESRINTVVVAAMTSNLNLTAAPGNVFVERSISKLPDDSVADVPQVLTIDKRLLTEEVGKLPDRILVSSPVIHDG